MAGRSPCRQTQDVRAVPQVRMEEQDAKKTGKSVGLFASACGGDDCGTVYADAGGGQALGCGDRL